MNTAAISTATCNWKAAYLSLAALLMRRRIALRISQEALADQLGVGRRTFQRWESGEIDPPAMRLFQWAALLGVNIAPDMAHSASGRAA